MWYETRLFASLRPAGDSLSLWEGLSPSFQRRQWHPTPVLLPGESHGRRSLVGCSAWFAKSQTRLNDFTFTFHFHALEKEMATHSSILAWRILGTWEPGGCRLWGQTESDTLKRLSSSSSSSSPPLNVFHPIKSGPPRVVSLKNFFLFIISLLGHLTSYLWHARSSSLTRGRN